jgi:hypothetical protein
MKVIKNRHNGLSRRAIINQGIAKAFNECVVCKQPLTRTFFVCDPCVEKHFGGDKRCMLSTFIDDIVLKSAINSGISGNGIVTLPSWAINPNDWFERRNYND